MPVRHANAVWEGTLKEGLGVLQFGGGAFTGSYSFGSRFEEGEGTNPEELLAAAHAGCFSMALSSNIGKAGFQPEEVRTTASVHLEKLESGWSVTRIKLDTQVKAPGIGEAEFQEQAKAAKENCPISRVLGDVEIQLEARLIQ